MMSNNKKPQAEKESHQTVSRAHRWTPQVIALSALVVIILTAVTIVSQNLGKKAETMDETQAAALKDQDLVLKTDQISDTAKIYPIDIDGTRMEVIAVKAPDGSIRTAFNTCQVCYDSGRGYYKQEGDMLVCQNCGNQFTMDRVEVEAGGCNPWPIFPENKTVTDESITISYDFLKESKEIFANWKSSY